MVFTVLLFVFVNDVSNVIINQRSTLMNFGDYNSRQLWLFFFALDFEFYRKHIFPVQMLISLTIRIRAPIIPSQQQILIECTPALPLDTGVNNTPIELLRGAVSSLVYLTDNHLIT